MCERCKDQVSDTFVKGMATILWGDAWADHAEEHACCNLSGCEITHVMPEIPEVAWRMAERLAGKIEQANGCALAVLFAQAMKAEGRPDLEHEDYHDETAERFGECLAWMAMGAGVSWYDDHPRFQVDLGLRKPFEMKVPDIENFDLQVWAGEHCDEETDRKPCPDCGAYVREGAARCSNCSKGLDWNDGAPALA